MHEDGGDADAQSDAATPVDRGQRDNRRRSETPETGVVVLITERSRVHILPPLPGKTASGSWIPVLISATPPKRYGRSEPGTSSHGPERISKMTVEV
jgi:hypothetical protein